MTPLIYMVDDAKTFPFSKWTGFEKGNPFLVPRLLACFSANESQNMRVEEDVLVSKKRHDS
jgi:hypothetical protein